MTIKFTRVMPAEASFGRNNDWFEITNTGDTWVDLEDGRLLDSHLIQLKVP